MAFEPVVVRGVATFKQNWQGSWVYWIAIPFWFGFFWLINMLTGLRLNVFTVAYLALTLAAIVPPLIYPIYARVVPGRIDILRSGVFNRTLRTCETFDLRGAAVLVDLNQRCVFVCRDDETREIGFGYVFDKPGFAHAVLLAAVSTHTPAPLPDDALIG